MPKAQGVRQLAVDSWQLAVFYILLLMKIKKSIFSDTLLFIIYQHEFVNLWI